MPRGVKKTEEAVIGNVEEGVVAAKTEATVVEVAKEAPEKKDAPIVTQEVATKTKHVKVRFNKPAEARIGKDNYKFPKSDKSVELPIDVATVFANCGYAIILE